MESIMEGVITCGVARVKRILKGHLPQIDPHVSFAFWNSCYSADLLSRPLSYFVGVTVEHLADQYLAQNTI